MAVVGKMKKSAMQISNRQAQQFGFSVSDRLLPDCERNDGIEPETDYKRSLISGFLKLLPTLSPQDKTLIYEQLINSGFTP